MPSLPVKNFWETRRSLKHPVSKQGKREVADPTMAPRTSVQKCHMPLPHTYHCSRQVTMPKHTPMAQKVQSFHRAKPSRKGFLPFNRNTIYQKGIHLYCVCLSLAQAEFLALRLYSHRNRRNRRWYWDPATTWVDSSSLIFFLLFVFPSLFSRWLSRHL